MSDARADDARGAARVRIEICGCFELLAINEMPAPSVLNERAPHGCRETVANQQVPEEIGALVEIAHGKVAEHGVAILRAAAPDGAVREQRFVAPRIAVLELFG